MHFKSFLLSLAFVLVACQLSAATQAQRDTPDCQPCIVQINNDLPLYKITFEIVPADSGNRIVKSILVTQFGNESKQQRLSVSEMTALDKDQKFFFKTLDLNKDGYLDMMLITSKGVANSYADYWVFDPANQIFRKLGNYPWLSLKGDEGFLQSYERGGHGGMIYTKKVYEFRGLSLVVREKEMQEWEADKNRYRKEIWRLENNELKMVHVEYSSP